MKPIAPLSEQVVMVIAVLGHYKPSDVAQSPVVKALGLQYGIVHGEIAFTLRLTMNPPMVYCSLQHAGLNGVLYLVVSFAQRDFLQIVLSRTFCPRHVKLGKKDDIVGINEVRW